MITRRLLLTSVGLAASGVARAQGTGKPFKIGVMADQNGIYSDVTGRGTVEAARLAVEDAGGAVLVRPVQVLVGDDQNKADVSSGLARHWIDEDGVEAIVVGGGSGPAMAVLAVAKEKNTTVLMSGPGSSDITGPLCATVSTHWAFDTYGLSSTVGKAVVQDGGRKWFFITADYSFGIALERDATRVIKAGGGTVVGSARHPVGTSDFSSYLLAARQSGADVIGLANAGSDLVNSIKQAQEFGLTRNGQRLAGLLLYVNDIQALGLEASRGTVGATSFYHDQTDATRAWTKRYDANFPGHIPNMVQAGSYAAVNHYLKAVKAIGTSEAIAVGKQMRATPVNDFYNHDIRIRTDGRVLQDMMLWYAKTPAESKGKTDLLALTQTVPGSEVYRPETEGGCPLVRS